MTPSNTDGSGIGQTVLGMVLTVACLWLLIEGLSFEQILRGQRATNWSHSPAVYLLSMAALFLGACLGAAMATRGLRGNPVAEEQD
jgi:hypothetical protein